MSATPCTCCKSSSGPQQIWAASGCQPADSFATKPHLILGGASVRVPLGRDAALAPVLETSEEVDDGAVLREPAVEVGRQRLQAVLDPFFFGRQRPLGGSGVVESGSMERDEWLRRLMSEGKCI